jgi:hypothetical protein
MYAFQSISVSLGEKKGLVHARVSRRVRNVQEILWMMSKLRNASPIIKRGLIHADCLGSWAMASPLRMRSILVERSDGVCAGDLSTSSFELALRAVNPVFHQAISNEFKIVYTYTCSYHERGCRSSEVSQPIGGDEARTSAEARPAHLPSKFTRSLQRVF